MKYQFSKYLLLRMPVKATVAYRNSVQSFLNDEAFKVALRLASPVYYDRLERQQFTAENLSEKELITLKKYINRYCFRPTPFGLFSSVTLKEWGQANNPQTTSPVFKVQVELAMPLQHLLSNAILNNQLLTNERFEGNPTIYRVLNEYRFIRTGLDDGGKSREYQLQSIAFSTLLKDLLALSNKGASLVQLIKAIETGANCSHDEAADYADFLINAQFLVSELRINITGEAHLLRLTRLLNDNTLQHNLLQLNTTLLNIPVAITSDWLDKLDQQIGSVITTQKLPTDQLSVILQHTNGSPTLDENYQRQLNDGVKALELLTPNSSMSSISNFINSYQQHFEGQALPLLQALDPEAGIGYQLPEQEKNNSLLETLHITHKQQDANQGSWTTIHAILLECWLRDKQSVPIIEISDSDLEKLKCEVQQSILGMSVLFRAFNDQVLIENIGGINAPALMGRFTVADPAITEAAKKMAQQLEAMNPDIIFAEVLHLADPHTDNVNRRAQLYQYEIPVTAASTLPKSHQIRLDDLYLKIINRQVVLFSKKHQKVVIPRLTSAYNHSINKLPLFRFLADLSYQFGRSNLALDLRQLFPNLSFYPRVAYKNTILSSACWVLNEVQINGLLSTATEPCESFNILKNELNLPRHFSLVEGDQELVFDSNHTSDLRFFCNCLRQKKEAVLKEYLPQLVVKQYNAYLLPSAPLTLPSMRQHNRATIKTQRKFVPGSEWLYLKVYCPKIGVNRLLLRLAPLLRKRYNGHAISGWFFIRYEDHAPHIRLRLKINPESLNEVLIGFKTKLEDRVQQHVIREFQVDTYSRELERYAAGGIANSETFFYASSTLFLNYLKKHKAVQKVNSPVFALYTTRQIIAQFIPDLERQIQFTLESFELFLSEFSGKNIRVNIDGKYRELSAAIQAAFKQNDPALFCGSVKAGSYFIESLQNIKDYLKGEVDYDYLRSLIHMHLNRLFTDESRKQEMVCYYLLFKYLSAVKGRHKQQLKS